MISKNLRAAACVGGAIAVSLLLWQPSASGGTAPESRASYTQIQNIHQDFGSKTMSGYFMSQGGHCLVTLMVIERTDPDQPTTQTAARLRLVLEPGQVAGLDSEEGQSVNVTCGEEADSVVIKAGSRERLAVLQSRALRKSLADAHIDAVR
jgi:hypothetical protein